MSDKQYNLTVHFKDGKTIEILVRDKVPATTGHNMLMWAEVSGWFYIVNELEVKYIECAPNGGDE